MVNGPPTPPATTPAELEDAARRTGTASASEPSVLLPPQMNAPMRTNAPLRQELDLRVVQGMNAAIARKDYQSVGSIAGEADILVCFVCVSLRETSRLMRALLDFTKS